MAYGETTQKGWRWRMVGKYRIAKLGMSMGVGVERFPREGGGGGGGGGGVVNA